MIRWDYTKKINTKKELDGIIEEVTDILRMRDFFSYLDDNYFELDLDYDYIKYKKVCEPSTPYEIYLNNLELGSWILYD